MWSLVPRPDFYRISTEREIYFGQQWTNMIPHMSTGTIATLAVTVTMLLLLIVNYLFAEQLYAYSFDPAWQSGTFNVRGSDAAEWLAFPEDRVGSVLVVLLVACLVAFVRQFRNDLAITKSGRRRV